MQVIWEAKVTNLTKSSTVDKRVGNFILHDPRTWKYVQKLGNMGILNAYGLTNDGIIANAIEINRAIDKNYLVIPNFYPEFAKGQEIAVRKTIFALHILECELSTNFLAVELNYSCPNSKEKIKENIEDAICCTKAIRQEFPSLCIIAKISYVHPYELAQELVGAGANIIHAINTIPYDMVYPGGSPSPLAKVGGGGVSGDPAKHQAFIYNYRLRKKLPSQTPIIMGCGITCTDDAKRYFEKAGADAISICSVARLNPREAEKIIEYYN
jgi:dihydroorotate dehydrogenase (NAD+) catalytic subunit